MSRKLETHPAFEGHLDPRLQELELELIKNSAEITPVEYYAEYYAALRQLSDYRCGHKGFV